MAKREMYAARKCIHCADGYREWHSNCVCCGCGPAPAAIEVLPRTKSAREYALDLLAHKMWREAMHQGVVEQQYRDHFRQQDEALASLQA